MRLIHTALLPLIIALLTAPAFADEHQPSGTISIQGQGTEIAEPDLAYVTSGVVAEAKTARAALDANTNQMRALVALLKAVNIADRDIQTSNFSVQPQFVYEKSSGQSSRPRIEGYLVSNSVRVRVRDISKLGDVLDQMVSNGANSIDNVSFAKEETEALYESARKQAMADAIQKAQIYADAAGVKLGRILSISENGGFHPQPVARMAMMEMASEPVPVQAGELTFSISVSVQWELDQ